jgi:hypothetical protein
MDKHKSSENEEEEEKEKTLRAYHAWIQKNHLVLDSIPIIDEVKRFPNESECLFKMKFNLEDLSKKNELFSDEVIVPIYRDEIVQLLWTPVYEAMKVCGYSHSECLKEARKCSGEGGKLAHKRLFRTRENDGQLLNCFPLCLTWWVDTAQPLRSVKRKAIRAKIQDMVCELEHVHPLKTPMSSLVTPPPPLPKAVAMPPPPPPRTVTKSIKPPTVISLTRPPPPPPPPPLPNPKPKPRPSSTETPSLSVKKQQQKTVEISQKRPPPPPAVSAPKKPATAAAVSVAPATGILSKLTTVSDTKKRKWTEGVVVNRTSQEKDSIDRDFIKGFEWKSQYLVDLEQQTLDEKRKKEEEEEKSRQQLKKKKTSTPVSSRPKITLTQIVNEEDDDD